METIHLKQYGITYRVVDKMHISVQKIGTLKVNGLKSQRIRS